MLKVENNHLYIIQERPQAVWLGATQYAQKVNAADSGAQRQYGEPGIELGGQR